MKESDVRILAAEGTFEGKPLHGKVEETHISWVILTRKDAFKIKKPVKLSFLDFSTLELRRQKCEREIELNSRFSKIYLSVLPVRFVNGNWQIGGDAGELTDYAVHMKRMALSKKMDTLLKARKVKQEAMKALAHEVARFHQRAEIITRPFDLAVARNTFNDIKLVLDFVIEKLGHQFSEIMEQSMVWSDQFLKSHAARIQQRIDRGFIRDVHGDLHSRNIFLYRKPVLFDCIEFNDPMRQIDVLYEIAFLCMDLEAYEQKNLSRYFLTEYKKKFRCFDCKEDESIFIYYKCLRANVRAKVNVMSATQADSSKKLLYHCEEAKKYLLLMNDYMKEIQADYHSMCPLILTKLY